MGDLQDLKGFDPNQNLPLDQSIIRHDTQVNNMTQDPFDEDMHKMKR